MLRDLAREVDDLVYVEVLADVPVVPEVQQVHPRDRRLHGCAIMVRIESEKLMIKNFKKSF